MAAAEVIVPQPSTSPQPPATPPSSPSLSPSDPLTEKHIPQIATLLKHVQADQPVATSGSLTAKAVEQGSTPAQPRIRASKLEFKSVDERWNEKTGRYEIVERHTPEEIEGLDEYVFVARVRTYKKTSETVLHIDIKSENLRGILREVLQDVHCISLMNDEPTVEANLIYHFCPELEAYRVRLDSDADRDALVLKHLNLLLNFMRREYAQTTDRVLSLLKNGEITYDFLWALFKPNTFVFSTCLDTDKPACFRFEMGIEVETSTGLTYFHLDCRSFDSDGVNFGEVSNGLGIKKFAGVRRIHQLEAYPLSYHREQNEVKAALIMQGKRFLSLLGSRHRQYRGIAFYLEKGDIIEVPVDSKIMVDAAFFRENNPNYMRPRINALVERRCQSEVWLGLETETDIKAINKEAKQMKDDDLLLCCPTVRGWSFDNRKWLEFAVDDISDIVWNPSAFANLAIPEPKKHLVLALAKARLHKDTEYAFDDFVKDKGQSLIILLHGSPGVGKTLTAEGLAEELQRPLYIICAGELGQDPQTIEDRLTHISRIAKHWNALILLDEADVFVQARSVDSRQNDRISVFLRKLEYMKGVLFMTTNRVRDFDPAIQSRITLALRYDTLSSSTRKQVWENFLKKAVTPQGAAQYNSKDLDHLAGKDLNGRQIKNMVAGAHALAVSENTRVSLSQLDTVIDLNEEFDADFGGSSRAANKHTYL